MNEIEQLRDLVRDMNITHVQVMDAVKTQLMNCHTMQDVDAVVGCIDHYMSEASKTIARI